MRSKKSETLRTLVFGRFSTLVFGRFAKTSGLNRVLFWVKTRLEVPNSSFWSIAEKSNKCSHTYLPKLFARHNLVNVAHKTK